LLWTVVIGVSLLVGCAQENKIIDRESKIPEDAIKVTPETDL